MKVLIDVTPETHLAIETVAGPRSVTRVLSIASNKIGKLFTAYGLTTVYDPNATNTILDKIDGLCDSTDRGVDDSGHQHLNGHGTRTVRRTARKSPNTNVDDERIDAKKRRRSTKKAQSAAADVQDH